MSLTTVVATLLVVALLEQCAAFRLNMPQTDDENDFTLKNFNYESNEGESHVSLLGRWPGLTAYPAMRNTSAWRQISSPDSKGITVTIKFEKVHLDYFLATAVFGDKEDHGKFNVNFKKQVFTLTLTATKIDKCELEVKVEGSDIRPTIDMSNLGDAGSSIEQGALKEEIETQLGKLLEKPLTNILTDNVQFVSRSFKYMNKTVLCERIMKSTSTQFPEPDLWD